MMTLTVMGDERCARGERAGAVSGRESSAGDDGGVEMCGDGGNVLEMPRG